mmetsp:Transcript_4599/g.7056  ORF Transcript_4599/g.7056 Transcript_4599/m.7056 type:complete len:181 (+) Transcript_4599:1-543(+)
MKTLVNSLGLAAALSIILVVHRRGSGRIFVPPRRRITRTITFEVDNAKDEGDYVALDELGCAQDTVNLRNKDEIVILESKITLVIDYPVRVEAIFSLHSNGNNGFSRLELANKVAECHRTMYREEHESMTVPAHTAQDVLQNRRKTNGKYGIWGHDIEDLLLRGVSFDELNGVWLAECDS